MLETEERRCYEALAYLRREYERAARPYVDALIHIHSLRPPQPIVLTTEQAADIMELQEVVKDAMQAG